MKDAVKQLKHIIKDDLSMGNASPRIDYNRLQYQIYNCIFQAYNKIIITILFDKYILDIIIPLN